VLTVAVAMGLMLPAAGGWQQESCSPGSGGWLALLHLDDTVLIPDKNDGCTIIALGNKSTAIHIVSLAYRCNKANRRLCLSSPSMHGKPIPFPS